MQRILDEGLSRLLQNQLFPKSLRAVLPTFGPAARRRPPTPEQIVARALGSRALPTYQGRSGPAVVLGELALAADRQPRIVGIDLTGSERRPSGWCLLAAGQAHTRTLQTDEELLAATAAARPTLVSIDSPLSLPQGRTRVTDDDPGRAEFGIMRDCERALKRRGINVYPALIPSMQRLTERGIRLAATLRAQGIPVIESYPGAAQDIMGIPRKRASLQMLREGLRDFGLTGPFLTEPVSHDELDAITAAVVGVFFWSGRFEALGSEDDEALIIPLPRPEDEAPRHRLVVGFSGPPGAGKTTAARALEQRGFGYGRYSMVLAGLLGDHAATVRRETLQAFGARINAERGQRWLGRRLLAQLPPTGNLVIDGLRFPDDHAFLAEVFGPGFVHVHVTAAVGLRQTRFGAREGSAPTTFAEADGHLVERAVGDLARLAHHRIVNEGGIAAFLKSVMAVLPPA